jgi:hypothetical protein
VQRKKLEDSVVVAPGGTKTERAWSGWSSGREVAERQRKFGEEAVSNMNDRALALETSKTR